MNNKSPAVSVFLVLVIAASFGYVARTIMPQGGDVAQVISSGMSRPNEPAGYTQLGVATMDQVPASGWTVSHAGNPSIVTDSASPEGSTNVANMHFSPTMMGGTAPGGLYPNSTAFSTMKPRSLYTSFWVKLSPVWTSPVQSGANKILYGLINNQPFSIEFLSFGFDSTEQLLQPAPVLENSPGVLNIGAALPINMVPYDATSAATRGVWHHYEVLMVMNTPGKYDGTYKWWFDGKLYGDYTNRVDWTDTPGLSFQTLYWEPTYGGSTIPPPTDQDMYLKDFYISGSPSGADGSTTSTPPPVTPPPPASPVVSISATPSSITAGQSSTLTWSSTNASSCTASGGWSGAQNTSGSQTVNPQITTTYSLSCTGSGGTSSQSTAVQVSTNPSAPPPPSNQLPVGNFDGLQGDGVTLYGWSYDPDTSASSNQVQIYVGGPKGSGVPLATLTANVSRPDVDSYFGISGSHGFLFPVPSTLTDGLPHTYYVYGVDTSDQTLSTQIGTPLTLTVASPTLPPPPPQPSAPTVAFSANPSLITAGQSTTLTWGSTNTSSCTATGGWSGTSVNTSGSMSFAPLLTTTYSLACTGDGGTVSKSVTVTVSTPPSTPPPSTLGIGSSVTTTDTVHVRLQGTTNAKQLGIQHVGARGIIKNGPVSAQGYTWWSVDFTSGSDGWVVGSYLK